MIRTTHAARGAIAVLTVCLLALAGCDRSQPKPGPKPISGTITPPAASAPAAPR
ncbi:hypothetical protein [Cupriavidus pampae]|uniref:hypothetical protein n=1 Tax=Cupriavidus pampae TaxID=659251 RepID=UPI001CC78AE0|nr:hypothetical protein [Cupriavidus pampae]